MNAVLYCLPVYLDVERIVESSASDYDAIVAIVRGHVHVLVALRKVD
jgi:hypothetical protein